MFTVRLEFADEKFSGLEAMDLARRLNLAPSSKLRGLRPHDVGRDTVEAEVPESFVRAWFGPKQTVSTATVPSELLEPRDVCRSVPEDRGYFEWDDLCTERICDLYVAVRFRGCRAQVQRLEDEVASLATQLHEAGIEID